MGKLIQFPVSRVRPPRHSMAGLFAAFSELQQEERAQLKLIGICSVGALLLMAALQLVAR